MPFLGKIRPIEELAVILSDRRNKGARIALCHGDFEVIHSGLVRRLATARRCADIVVVVLEADQYLARWPGRPWFSEGLRAEAVAAIADVDFVTVNRSSGAAQAIRILKPHVYIREGAQDENESKNAECIEAEDKAIHDVGASIETMSSAPYPSPASVSELLGVFPPEVDRFVRNFRATYRAADVLNAIEELKALKVLVVGEAIIDEYVYGDTLGKSAKEPILALRFLSKERHAGGSVVIANHLADFCCKVGLVTYLGESDTHEEFIRGNLRENVQPEFIYKSGAPTIVKRRFVEKYLVSKLLEVYEINDEPLKSSEEASLCETLKRLIPEYDLVIAADYGHGLITPKVVDMLCNEAGFLSVNTQINAANNGYHTISRFPRADYVCLHEGEVRLDQRDRGGDLRSLVKRLADRMRCRLVMVTQGKHGSLLYDGTKGFFSCPAFAVKVVDRVGAGDSVLAISSLCAAKGLPPEMTGFISNMVGAQAVMIVGNRSPISREQLILSVQGILG
jgi:rfaE bifunctional protein kinase chain/domain